MACASLPPQTDQTDRSVQEAGKQRRRCYDPRFSWNAEQDHALQFMMPQGSRSRLRRDEMRTIVAHIYRLVAADLRPGALQEDATLHTKLTDWIVDTLKYLQSATAGPASPELP